tara:strand:- start:1679 stop:1945 length:267 start_codon:yes stop_codon:yes gene_type:complete
MKGSQKKILSKYASDVANRGFSVPAVFFLEMFKYLSFIMSQTMIVFGPLATIFVNEKKYYNTAEILSNRDNMEFFICEIEKNGRDKKW